MSARRARAIRGHIVSPGWKTLVTPRRLGEARKVFGRAGQGRASFLGQGRGRRGGRNEAAPARLHPTSTPTFAKPPTFITPLLFLSLSPTPPRHSFIFACFSIFCIAVQPTPCPIASVDVAAPGLAPPATFSLSQIPSRVQSITCSDATPPLLLRHLHQELAHALPFAPRRVARLPPPPSIQPPSDRDVCRRSSCGHDTPRRHAQGVGRRGGQGEGEAIQMSVL